MSKEKQNKEMRDLAKLMGEAISTERERRYIEDEAKLEAVLRENGWSKQSEGEWISRSLNFEGYLTRYYCSCCDNMMKWKTNYCSNCGAKMRKEDEGK